MRKKILGIYPISEDSIFLSEILKKEVPKLLIQNRELRVLDMGAGSGIQSETCVFLGVKEKNITLVDINKKAIELLRRKFANCHIIKSNLFSKISKKEKFDLMIFNPPYLPKDKFDKELDTAGGKFGSEIINKFLKKARKYGNKNFFILLLTSSQTKKIDFRKYEKELLAEKNLFFEKLFVWKLK
jgi:HemK-related putative methylase